VSALLYILALSGLWTVLVLGAVVGLFVLVGYAIYTLRSDEGWEERRSLLAAVRSKVLPEADVVMMNPAHPDAARVPPLVTRPFSFAECLHTPPMSARYKSDSSMSSCTDGRSSQPSSERSV